MSQTLSSNGDSNAVRFDLREALALQNAGHLDKAARIYRAVLKSHPSNANAWNLLGTLSVRRGNLARARPQFEKDISVDQRSADAHQNLGVLLRQLGEMAGSRHHLEEAIRLKPDYADAYFNYAACRRFEPGDPLASTVEDLLRRDGVPEGDLCTLHFTAGKIYDDMGEVERAFGHFREANRLPVFELRYEDLVEDQDKITRDLLSFCGLSWDPGS